MKQSTMRWAKRGITYWLSEDLSVNIMKWENQDGCKITVPTTEEVDA